ncbi:MAG: hypothetical protein Q9191_000820 [Dirinaria sp. TL-2023a]
MSQKRPRSVSPLLDALPTTYRSSTIEDRASKFTAIFSPSIAVEDLQARAEFKSASHRIAAWRRPSTQRSLTAKQVYDTGHDDDGEKYGGKTLEKVLNATDVVGAVVVARWYGGVLLGPARFDHIRHCAHEAISHFEEARESSAKRAKIVEDKNKRDELIRVLPERDQSIGVLRGLLSEKQNVKKPQADPKNSPAKVPNYSTLPLPVLENLERARDATIGWILKQIEKAEEAEGKPPDPHG